jgi:hypothetical protein
MSSTMSGMSSTMSMDMASATMSAAMPAATEEMSMDGMGMGDGCVISVSMMILLQVYTY